MIKRMLLLAAVAVLPLAASATDYYLSDCQAGADAACVPGDDTWDGLSPTFTSGTHGPKRTWAGVTGLVKKGNRFLWARGGAWDNARMRVYAAGSTLGDSITWDAYQPAWCQGSCAGKQPWLRETRANTTLFSFDDGNFLQDGGYVVRNLKLDGGGTGGWGIFLEKKVDDVLLEKLTITGFDIGVFSNQNPESSTTPKWSNDRITFRDSALSNNRSFGWLGGGTDLVVENVSSDNDGGPSLLLHSFYFSDIRRGMIRGLEITNPVRDPATGKCSGSVVELHGVVRDMVFENIHITGPAAGAVPYCFGFDFSPGYSDDKLHPAGESMVRITIRGSKITDVGYVGIGVRSCQHCVIEDNELVWINPKAQMAYGISTAGGNAPKGLDVLNDAITIRNNSIYIGTPAAVSTNPIGIQFSNEGSSHSVTNNLIEFAPNTAAAARCYALAGRTRADFRQWDNNLCHRSGGYGSYSDLFPTLAAAQAALVPWDAHGSNADPLFVAAPSAANGYSLAVRQGSPVLGAGDQVERSRLALGGFLVNGPRDIGARQFNASVVAPLSPAPFFAR